MSLPPTESTADNVQALAGEILVFSGRKKMSTEMEAVVAELESLRFRAHQAMDPFR